jgi:hypothetical protein
VYRAQLPAPSTRLSRLGHTSDRIHLSPLTSPILLVCVPHVLTKHLSQSSLSFTSCTPGPRTPKYCTRHPVQDTLTTTTARPPPSTVPRQSTTTSHPSHQPTNHYQPNQPPNPAHLKPDPSTLPDLLTIPPQPNSSLLVTSSCCGQTPQEQETRSSFSPVVSPRRVYLLTAISSACHPQTRPRPDCCRSPFGFASALPSTRLPRSSARSPPARPFSAPATVLCLTASRLHCLIHSRPPINSKVSRRLCISKESPSSYLTFHLWPFLSVPPVRAVCPRRLHHGRHHRPARPGLPFWPRRPRRREWQCRG